MLVRETPVWGARLMDLERHGDARGFFARMYCAHQLKELGLESRFVQANDSFSARRGTLRGLHYQLPPAAEVKIVRCIRGALFDVILDLRPESPTSGEWFGAELTAENRLMMYVPRGCAHAILTLTDDTEALYLTSSSYAPEREGGVRWNDPRFGIAWPIEPAEISAKDAAWPDFDPAAHGVEQLRGLV
ncbi:MAG TPA: dTDP-4-dehydrorhamnose 3,5-epimerase [Rhizomicrobium sp.]|jgi:dTDP-4-dehydrorhamnose 3,5-epimerase